MRFEHRREFYIPKDATLQNSNGTDAAVYFFQRLGKPCAMGFHGKAQKPDFHHSFRTDDARAQHLARFIDGRRRTAAARAELRADRQRPHTLEPGAILVSSWGYDQTNVDFYQVARVIGPHTVELQPIGKATVPDRGTGNGMADYVTADPTFKAGELLLRRASAGNRVRICDVRSASPWNGQPCYRSWYA